MKSEGQRFKFFVLFIYLVEKNNINNNKERSDFMNILITGISSRIGKILKEKKIEIDIIVNITWTHKMVSFAETKYQIMKNIIYINLL